MIRLCTFADSQKTPIVNICLVPALFHKTYLQITFKHLWNQPQFIPTHIVNAEWYGTTGQQLLGCSLTGSLISINRTDKTPPCTISSNHCHNKTLNQNARKGRNASDAPSAATAWSRGLDECRSSWWACRVSSPTGLGRSILRSQTQQGSLIGSVLIVAWGTYPMSDGGGLKKKNGLHFSQSWSTIWGRSVLFVMSFRETRLFWNMFIYKI